MRRKAWVWAVLAAPAGWMLLEYVSGTASYGLTIHRSGQVSVALLVAALAATPLSRAFGQNRLTAALMFHRRAIGVASFGYAAVHTVVYLERKWGAGLIVAEATEVWLLTGWLALLVLLVLALTSNRSSVNRMGARWKLLHRAVYVGTLLAFAHWLLATVDATWALATLGLLVVVELGRLRTTTG